MANMAHPGLAQANTNLPANIIIGALNMLEMNVLTESKQNKNKVRSTMPMSKTKFNFEVLMDDDDNDDDAVPDDQYFVTLSDSDEIIDPSNKINKKEFIEDSKSLDNDIRKVVTSLLAEAIDDITESIIERINMYDPNHISVKTYDCETQTCNSSSTCDTMIKTEENNELRSQRDKLVR